MFTWTILGAGAALTIFFVAISAADRKSRERQDRWRRARAQRVLARNG